MPTCRILITKSFFFQAEDGIRDLYVTGVQTCALPICLAVGVDTTAHKAALNAGGRTIAVVACGLDKIYPEENVPLAKLIAESGAVLKIGRASCRERV